MVKLLDMIEGNSPKYWQRIFRLVLGFFFVMSVGIFTFGPPLISAFSGILVLLGVVTVIASTFVMIMFIERILKVVSEMRHNK